MKVNIVWASPQDDHILARLARKLAEFTGWSLSVRPDPRADLNYSMVYIDLAQRFSDWQQTPWAAYFSHYEKGSEYKEFWWETALPLTRIQTVTADQYGALVPNPVKVTPPVNPIFRQVLNHKNNNIPVIGVSGFVDRKSGRKGEKLVARLANDIDSIDLVASGDGWPVKTVNHSFGDLPNFYNSLDLYFCSSSIEGIPMPPLEALACGIPVIIPRGVGMLDELPNERGVYRYDVNDYDSLRKTVDFAVEDSRGLDRDILRSYVAGYTPEAWGESHRNGFFLAMEKQSPVNGHNVPHMTHDRHGQRGVYYVAYGVPARKCAMGAIASFKKYLPDIPVALVSDSPLGPEDIFIECPDEDIGGRAAKVRVDELAPKDWAYICYLDADTEITAAETFLWNIVEDGWDMVICKNPSRFHIASQMRRSDNGDECDYTFGRIGTDQLIQLNGGVFCYQRNERTRAFFDCWHHEWRKYGKRDQAALLRALFQYPLKLYVLGNEWNTITRYDSPESGAWLLHYPMTARRWRGVIHHALNSPEAWEAVKQFERAKK